MALTFAGNGIYLGVLAGIAAAVVTKNAAVGVLVALVGSVGGWYAIRAFETLLGRGVDAGITAISNKFHATRPARSQYPGGGQSPIGPHGYPTANPPSFPAQPRQVPAPGQPSHPPAQAGRYPTYPLS